MNINDIARKLFPRKTQFYDLLEASARNLSNAAQLLTTLAKQDVKAERNVTIDRIKELELQGDHVTHQISKALSTTFITPIDAEDIHALASALDDTMDRIEGLAMRVRLYNIETLPPSFLEMISILTKQIECISEIIPQLRVLQKASNIMDRCVEIHELENELQYIVFTPSFINNDYGELVQIVRNQLDRNSLIDQFFVLFEDGDPLFPPFNLSGRNYVSGEPIDFTGMQKNKLEQAENYEFSYHNYREAISLLEEILSNTEKKDLQARLMNCIARNQVKQNNYSNAIENYNTIINDFPESVTSSGIPLPVTVRLQLVDCYIKTGQDSEALKETLNAFDEILNQYYNLSETRFKAYVSMVRDKFNILLKDIQETEYPDPAYADEFENFNTRYNPSYHGNLFRIVTMLKTYSGIQRESDQMISLFCR